jgi:DNA-3-methyladenine glycosylase II
MAEGRFELRPVGPYSLAASVRFLEGFAPAAYEGHGEGHLHLAFVADGGENVAGVCVREEGAVILGEVSGDAGVEVVKRQVERILSLDVDGSAFPEVGRRDPVVAELQARYPGLRPICFHSPYEAAAWALIGQRIRIVQAARIKNRMAEELGPTVEIHGVREHAFPGPQRLETLETFPGLTARKVEYLRRLGHEAAEQKLDAAYLRSLPEQEALARLEELPGIGPFSSGLILLRGAGSPDLLPAREPRLGRAVSIAYNLKAPPTPQDLQDLAQTWRPYRTWVALHLRVMLEEETAEINQQAKSQKRGRSPIS